MGRARVRASFTTQGGVEMVDERTDKNELQERFRHFEERRGLVEVGHLPIRQANGALSRSVPTMHHAVRLFEKVRELLGERAWVDPSFGEPREELFVFDEDGWMAVEPLLCLSRGPGGGGRGRGSGQTVMRIVNPDPVVPDDAPPGWKHGDGPFRKPSPPLDIVPRTDMFAGSIRIAEGSSHVQIHYGDDGRISEVYATTGDQFTNLRHPATKPYVVDPSCRPPTVPPLGILCRADLDPNGHPLERMAEMVIELVPSLLERTPGRMRVPAPLPGGAAGVWEIGRRALERHLRDVPAERGGRHLVVDGLSGIASGVGATLDEAVVAWDADVFRAKPRRDTGGAAAREDADAGAIEDAAAGDGGAEGGADREEDSEEGRLEEPHRLPGPVVDETGKRVGYTTGKIEIRVGPEPSAVSLPPAIPGKIPCVRVELPAMAEVPEPFARIGFERWVGVVGSHGQVRAMLLRTDGARGFTAVGEEILDLVDPAALEEELEAGRVAYRADLPGDPPPWDEPELRVERLCFRVWEDDRQRRIPAKGTGGSYQGRSSGLVFAGDSAPWQIVQERVRVELVLV